MPRPCPPEAAIVATRRRFVCMALSLAAAGALAGCAEAQPAPRAVKLKRENCDYCGMPISDARYAAEIWNADVSRVRVYDDFGCAVIAASQRKELERRDIAFWVADETDPTRWLDARSARYRDGVATPMGHGYAAGPEAGHPLGFAAASAAICEKALCAHPA
jgi:hypothetical protein